MTALTVQAGRNGDEDSEIDFWTHREAAGGEGCAAAFGVDKWGFEFLPIISFTFSFQEGKKKQQPTEHSPFLLEVFSPADNIADTLQQKISPKTAYNEIIYHLVPIPTTIVPNPAITIIAGAFTGELFVLEVGNRRPRCNKPSSKIPTAPGWSPATGGGSIAGWG